MDAKLTLKLDKEVIEKAKEYAAKHKNSLSSMVENYFMAVTSMKKPETDESIKVSELAKSFTITKEEASKINFDYKKELRDILSQKHDL
jgi:hypothetical protein